MRDFEYHRPVLVEQVMHFLIGRPGLYLDGTLGGGGHAEALLSRCGDCILLGVDQDPTALDEARARLMAFSGRVTFACTSFADVTQHPTLCAEGLAGALLDLGVSSHQLDDERRGFTFRRGAPLDMRMSAGNGATAADFLATASGGELVRALRSGDAPKPGPLAKKILWRRAEKPFQSSDDLVAVLESVLRRRATHAEKARLFQALRIVVNDELAVLAEGLLAIRDALNPGATFVVISYHSGEDRLVKRAFREWSNPSARLPRRLPVRATDLAAAGELLTKKPVLASEAEVEANTRARPARLRAWRRAA